MVKVRAGGSCRPAARPRTRGRTTLPIRQPERTPEVLVSAHAQAKLGDDEAKAHSPPRKPLTLLLVDAGVHAAGHDRQAARLGGIEQALHVCGVTAGLACSRRARGKGDAVRVLLNRWD